MSDYEETVGFAISENTLRIIVAKCRTDLVPAILQQLCPGGKQHFIIGYLKNTAISETWLHIARLLQAPVFGFQQLIDAVNKLVQFLTVLLHRCPFAQL